LYDSWIHHNNMELGLFNCVSSNVFPQIIWTCTSMSNTFCIVFVQIYWPYWVNRLQISSAHIYAIPSAKQRHFIIDHKFNWTSLPGTMIFILRRSVRSLWWILVEKSWPTCLLTVVCRNVLSLHCAVSEIIF